MFFLVFFDLFLYFIKKNLVIYICIVISIIKEYFLIIDIDKKFIIIIFLLNIYIFNSIIIIIIRFRDFI